jgi:2,4-dienoyl-CoA reductase-like NADH-dependent reductase (Old Yellow Enzyme family)
LGKKFPIFIKLNTQDYIQNGLTLDEGKQIAKILIDTGYDAIEPSSGLNDIKFSEGKTYPCFILKSKEDENYFLPKVHALKPEMKDRPIILQGGIRNPSVADEFIRNKVADFVALSRPLIYEPNLPNRWKDGDFTPSLCTNCNLCLNVGATDTVYCVVKKKKS